MGKQIVLSLDRSVYLLILPKNTINQITTYILLNYYIYKNLKFKYLNYIFLFFHWILLKVMTLWSREKNFWTHKTPTRKNIGPTNLNTRNTHEKKFRTHETSIDGRSLSQKGRINWLEPLQNFLLMKILSCLLCCGSLSIVFAWFSF